ncbi:MAG: sulfate ABC transporter permease subunit [Jatrophihabitantaceae bacterium]
MADSTRTKSLLRALAVGYIAILVLVPMGVVTWRTVSDGWTVFWRAISSEQAVTAFRLTLEIAFAAVAINVLFGVGVALLISRYRFRGRRLLGSLTDLSVSVSPIVVGLALILVYGPYNGFFGRVLAQHGFQVIFSLPGMIMATAFVSMPLVLRSVLPVLDEEGIEQEQAAKVLGATAVQRFLRITLPTIRPALGYGTVLSLARSIGEFGAVKVVSGNIGGVGQTQTATLLIDERSEQFEPGSYPLAFVLILATVVAIAIVSPRRGRRARA